MQYKALLLLALMPMLCHAEWISNIDKKYRAKNPALYEVVLKNKKIIDKGPEYSENEAPALFELQSLLNEHKAFAPAYVQLARVTINLGYISADNFEQEALDQGIVHLKQALALEPNYDYAMAMMGYILLMEGRLDDAARYYDQALALHSKYPYLKEQMATLERKRGNIQKAIQLLEEGYAENKNNPKVLSGYTTALIYAYEALPDDHNSAISKLQQERVRLSPNSAWYWGDFAHFELYYTGDYEAAIKYGVKALSLMNYGVGRQTLAMAYYAKWGFLADKNTTAAQTILARANDLYPLTEESLAQLIYYGHGHYNDLEQILKTQIK